jgi:hypothetical protein
MQSNNVEVFFADMGAKWYLLAAQKGLPLEDGFRR